MAQHTPPVNTPTTARWALTEQHLVSPLCDTCGHHYTGGFAPWYYPNTRAFPSECGHLNSHQAVRKWAEYLGTDIHFSYGKAPTARAVIDGIGVCMWCATDSASVEEEL